jgi:hypothetical protein
MQLSAAARPHLVPTKSTRRIRPFEQVRTRVRLTGAKAVPIADRMAIRIVELAHAGEFDPDKLTEAALAEFGV